MTQHNDAQAASLISIALDLRKETILLMIPGTCLNSSLPERILSILMMGMARGTWSINLSSSDKVPCCLGSNTLLTVEKILQPQNGR